MGCFDTYTTVSYAYLTHLAGRCYLCGICGYMRCSVCGPANHLRAYRAFPEAYDVALSCCKSQHISATLACKCQLSRECSEAWKVGSLGGAWTAVRLCRTVARARSSLTSNLTRTLTLARIGIVARTLAYHARRSMCSRPAEVLSHGL